MSVNGSQAYSLNLPSTIKATFVGNVTGNASSATKLAAKKSSHSDHLFHTEWGKQDISGLMLPCLTENGGYMYAGRLKAHPQPRQHDPTVPYQRPQPAGNTITTTYATKAENNTKANDSDVVHKSGNETIVGTKTFNDNVHATGFLVQLSANAFMAQYGEYALVLRIDSSDTYLLMSDKGGVPGTWSNARPLIIHNSTGVCDINGNAATASRSTNNGGFYINGYLVTIG